LAETDGKPYYPGFIEYRNTPSSFGTVPGFDGVLPLSHYKRRVSPAFGPVAGLSVSGDRAAVFRNAANKGKRRGLRGLCLSFETLEDGHEGKRPAPKLLCATCILGTNLICQRLLKSSRV